MVEAKELYEAHRVSSEVFLGEFLNPWEKLTWEIKDYWQQQADELNEARLNNELS